MLELEGRPQEINFSWNENFISWDMEGQRVLQGYSNYQNQKLNLDLVVIGS